MSNVCTNPDFETDLTGWTVTHGGGEVTMSRDTVEQHAGVASCEVVTAGSVQAEGVFFLASHVLGGGETLTARVWVKGTGELKVWAATRNGGLYREFTKTVVNLTGVWQQVEAQVTKTLSQDQVEVRVSTSDDVAAQAVTFYVDDVELLVPDAVPTGDLRPDSDVSAGNWITAPLWSKLDEETESDADFIEHPENNNSACELGLTNPGSSPGVGIYTLRVRAAKDAAGGNQRGIDYAVVEGTTVRASGTLQADLTETFTTYEVAPDLSGVTDWTDVRVRLTSTGTTGGPGGNRRAIHVSWVELEIPAGEIAKNGVDAGTLASSVALAADEATLDSTTLSETALIEAALVGADAVAFSEIASLEQAKTGTDAATVDEALTTESSLAATDAATLVEGIVPAAALVDDDAATLTDAGTAQAGGSAPTAADTAALAEAALVEVEVSTADAATAGDAVANAAATAAQDAASLSEALAETQAALTAADASALAESRTLQAGNDRQDQDTATLIEAAAIEVLLAATDVITQAEAIAAEAALAGADAAAATDSAAGPGAALASTDVAATAEAILLAAALALADELALADLSAREVVGAVSRTSAFDPLAPGSQTGTPSADDFDPFGGSGGFGSAPHGDTFDPRNEP